MAELFGRQPLFPGEDFLDQVQRIISVLGTPSSEDMKYIGKSYLIQETKMRLNILSLCQNDLSKVGKNYSQISSQLQLTFSLKCLPSTLISVILSRSVLLILISMACMTKNRKSSARKFSTGAGITSNLQRKSCKILSMIRVSFSILNQLRLQKNPKEISKNLLMVPSTSSTNDLIAAHYVPCY